jgi:hypothetical protein
MVAQSNLRSDNHWVYEPGLLRYLGCLAESVCIKDFTAA